MTPLQVRPLTRADLSSLLWAGGRAHLPYVAEALRRRDRGEVVYLALVDADDTPLALGGVDLVVSPGHGMLWQLATHPSLRSHGLGTRLMAALEDEVRSRNLTPRLEVEEENLRALALYERRGYEVVGASTAEWEVEEGGHTRLHRARCFVMEQRPKRAA